MWKDQRCWWHKIGNVLAALPRSAHPAAKKAVAEIYNAENKAAAVMPPTPSRPGTERSGPRRLPRSSTALDVLTAFCDYPAEHWIDLRTTTPIESTFATVRLRAQVTEGSGSGAAGVAMAFKQQRCRGHR